MKKYNIFRVNEDDSIDLYSHLRDEKPSHTLCVQLNPFSHRFDLCMISNNRKEFISSHDSYAQACKSALDFIK